MFRLIVSRLNRLTHLTGSWGRKSGLRLHQFRQQLLECEGSLFARCHRETLASQGDCRTAPASARRAERHGGSSAPSGQGACADGMTRRSLCPDKNPLSLSLSKATRLDLSHARPAHDPGSVAFSKPGPPRVGFDRLSLNGMGRLGMGSEARLSLSCSPHQPSRSRRKVVPAVHCEKRGNCRSGHHDTANARSLPCRGEIRRLAME